MTRIGPLLGLLVLLPLWSASIAAAPAAESGGERQRMIVLGIDGVDPEMLRGYMAEGLMPNFSKLARMGGLMPLGTSIPPQSPVAWSNFIDQILNFGIVQWLTARSNRYAA